MKILIKIVGHILSVPARIRGVKFGKNTFIGPGYTIQPVLKGVILGDNVVVARNAWFTISKEAKDAQIIIGDGTSIGRNVVMSACKKISIGKKCLISYNVSFLDHEHQLFDINYSPCDGGISKEIEIIVEDNCFIGAHSFIMKGVHLGKRCVVGANSVVNKSFPDYSVVAGSPAKLIRTLNGSSSKKEETKL